MSRTVLLLLPLLLLPDSPATASSPAVVYPCRSGDVQREGGEGSSPMQEPNSGRNWCEFFHCEDFDLYLVGVQAPLGLDVERVPRSFVHATSWAILLFWKDPQDGVVGVDTVENCKRKK
jgi:hypothetical protein